jgi:hypothetical protein
VLGAGGGGLNGRIRDLVVVVAWGTLGCLGGVLDPIWAPKGKVNGKTGCSPSMGGP